MIGTSKPFRASSTVTVSFSTWGDGQVAWESSKSLNCGMVEDEPAVVADGRVALGARGGPACSPASFLFDWAHHAACVGLGCLRSAFGSNRFFTCGGSAAPDGSEGAQLSDARSLLVWRLAVVCWSWGPASALVLSFKVGPEKRS